MDGNITQFPSIMSDRTPGYRSLVKTAIFQDTPRQTQKKGILKCTNTHGMWDKQVGTHIRGHTNGSFFLHGSFKGWWQSNLAVLRGRGTHWGSSHIHTCGLQRAAQTTKSRTTREHAQQEVTVTVFTCTYYSSFWSYSEKDNTMAKLLTRLMKGNIPLIFPFTCSRAK